MEDTKDPEVNEKDSDNVTFIGDNEVIGEEEGTPEPLVTEEEKVSLGVTKDPSAPIQPNLPDTEIDKSLPTPVAAVVGVCKKVVYVVFGLLALIFNSIGNFLDKIANKCST